MTRVGRGDRGQGTATSEAEEGVAFPRWLAMCGFIVLLSVLPILGHGCHRGDHDFEPTAVPLDSRAIQVELPR